MSRPPGRLDPSRSVVLGLAIAAALLVPDVLAPGAGVLVRALLAGTSAALVAALGSWIAAKLGAE